jgi:hypothetical protein
LSPLPFFVGDVKIEETRQLSNIPGAGYFPLTTTYHFFLAMVNDWERRANQLLFNVR